MKFKVLIIFEVLIFLISIILLSLTIKSSKVETIEIERIRADKLFNEQINEEVEEVAQTEENRLTIAYQGEDYTLTIISKEDLDVLERCVEAEAGNQGLLGKQYVTDVILNRMYSDDYPNSIIGVIYQENQFEVVNCGTIETINVSEETKEAIQLELESRLDESIIHFKTKDYHKFGEPMFQHKDHYFSK